MQTMRLVTLASGLAALVLGAGSAGAQTTNAYGADRYGGAKVGEDLSRPATDNASGLNQDQTNQVQPSEVQPTSGHDQTYQNQTPSQATPSDQTQSQSVSPNGTTPTVNQNVTVTPPAATQTPSETTTPAPATTPPPAEVNVYMPPPAQPERIVEERHYAPFGMALSVGGGITEFSGREMRDTTNLGGTWDARLTLGTRSLIGLEAAYVGTAAPINALGLDQNAVIMSNGVEGLARLNIGTYDFQPFVIGGVGWQRYSIENSSSNTSDFRNSDDVLAIPFGAGVSTYIGGKDSHFMVDARFIYRATFNDNLAKPGTADSGGNGLSNWSTTLRLGYEF